MRAHKKAGEPVPVGRRRAGGCVSFTVSFTHAFLSLVKEFFINDCLMVPLYNDPFGSGIYFICIILGAVPAKGAGINRILQYVFNRTFLKRLVMGCFKSYRVQIAGNVEDAAAIIHIFAENSTDHLSFFRNDHRRFSPVCNFIAQRRACLEGAAQGIFFHTAEYLA